MRSEGLLLGEGKIIHFHLGDNYYVNVKYRVESTSDNYGWTYRCWMWVGETWLHPIIINNFPISVVVVRTEETLGKSGENIIELTKQEMTNLLLDFKQELIEFIKQQS